MASAAAPSARDSLKKGAKPQRQGARSLKRKRQEEDHADLEAKVADLDLSTPVTSFAELPLSKATASGLANSHFKTLTSIQQKGIPIALQGRDVLGAAKTGSGKTLAFLIPVLEKLVRARWTELDGLGALIISPTRELAVQIFDVLRKIGRYHTFSAALVVGGKNLQEERERLQKINIIVCTPGRMLQHLDQTADFQVENLQMLVLDEADRILDMGFQTDVDALLDHLPTDRQTLLFSATQTKRVSDLARLSLKEPEYISVHENANMATPDKLKQHYVVTPLQEKLDTLWSFLKSNKKAKIIVFLSSGKQVRFVYESFRHLQPGISLLHLHGRQKQAQRLEITHKFRSTKMACLFATDVAARGLDFPAVDWVIQLDCPEDAETYIHRAGRTARFENEGQAVLFLDPSEEEAMLKRLEQKKVPIEKINVRHGKQTSIKDQLQNMCFKDPELKRLGQQAFTTYAKSIYVAKDKEVFDLQKLALEEFAASLGLPGAPRIKFHKGDNAKEIKNASRDQKFIAMRDENSNSEQSKQPRTRYDRMFQRQNQDLFSSRYTELIEDGENVVVDSDNQDNEEDEFMKPKRRLISASLSPEPLPDGHDSTLEDVAAPRTVQLEGGRTLIIDSKRREKLLKSKKKLLKYQGASTKITFDEDGNAHELYELEDEDDFKRQGPAPEQRRKFVENGAEKVKNMDIDDKAVAKRKRQEKKEKRKAKERAAKEAEMQASDEEEGGAVAVLAGAGEFVDPFASDDEWDAHKEDETRNHKSSKKRRANSDEDIASKSRKPKRRTHTAREDSYEPETLEDLEALAASYL